MSETPRYTHDCDSCVFLGRWSRYDLYFADHGGLPNTVIARFGSDGPEYTSGLPLAELDPALLMAKLRAQQLGLLPCDLPGCDQLRQQLEQVTRERDEAHGRGVSSGKQEALRYTPEERESYGKHVEAAEQYATLRQRVADLEAALTQIATDSAVSSLQSNSGLNPRRIARAILDKAAPDAQSGATP